MNAQDLGFMLMGGLIVLFFTFMAWHPDNNDYVSKEDYNNLYQEYITLQQEHETLKQDMSNLILEFYGKNLALDFLGIKKYKLTFCALQKYLVREIPLVKSVC